MQIVELTGLSYPTVRKAIDLYTQGGMAAIAPARRGRAIGVGRSLTAEQEAQIRRIICDERPEQLKMDFALWNRMAVSELIARECGIRLSARGLGTYLKRWGLALQKPTRGAHEQSPEAAQAWLSEQYPHIEARAKAEGGEIHWGVETALTTTHLRGSSYPSTDPPPAKLAVDGPRQKLWVIAAVTNKNKARWMIIEGAYNSVRLIEFLGALIKDVDKKAILILDNLRIHHSPPVKAWVAEHQERIALIYLPS